MLYVIQNRKLSFLDLRSEEDGGSLHSPGLLVVLLVYLLVQVKAAGVLGVDVGFPLVELFLLFLELLLNGGILFILFQEALRGN